MCMPVAAREDEPMYQYERELLGLIGNGENSLDKKIQYGVELLVVLDYAIYKLWVLEDFIYYYTILYSKIYKYSYENM